MPLAAAIAALPRVGVAADEVRTLLLPLPGPGVATVAAAGPGVPGVVVAGVLAMEVGAMAVLGVKIGEVIEGEGMFMGDPTRLKPRPVPIEGAGEPILSGFIIASLIVGVTIPTLMPI